LVVAKLNVQHSLGDRLDYWRWCCPWLFAEKGAGERIHHCLRGFWGNVYRYITFHYHRSRPHVQAATPPTTEENIEENLKLWADHLAMSLLRQPLPNGDIFSYIGRVQGNNDPVEVFVAKEKPGYLQFKTVLDASPEHQAILAKLTEHNYAKVLNEIGMEISRLRMATGLSFPMDKTHHPIGPMTIFIQKGIPISDLNEGVFAKTFDEVTGATAQVRAAVNIALDTSPLPAQPIKQPVSQ
jgi:hypothetical protein